ncbi:MAG: choice-of-anchor D domain-containing protein [Chloroherpetonaceae bacterium]|nr:choice-of-anchor D domain-containing protein [Chloroherpetonaceae bacterium]
MNRLFATLLFLALFQRASAQTIDTVIAFPNSNSWNFIWGVTRVGDTLFLGDDNFGDIIRVTVRGDTLGRIDLPNFYNFNHGLEFNGTHFLVAQDYRLAGARLYRFTRQGQVVDSILFPLVIGDNNGPPMRPGGIGDIALDRNGHLWFAVYEPDNIPSSGGGSYPFAYAYKWDYVNNVVLDTVPLHNGQVQGIAVKGDTLFYVGDNFHNNQPERIYAVNLNSPTKDTLFSFPMPDPDNDQDPRGLYWDGRHLWSIAFRVGNNINRFRVLYRFRIDGGGTPKISLSTSAINFGNVVLNRRDSIAFTIRNIGSAPLRLNGFATAPNHDFGLNVGNDTLAPGASKTFFAFFQPQSFGDQEATFLIASNDPTEPQKSLTMRGRGVFQGKHLHLGATQHNFGARRHNARCGYFLALENRGTDSLQIAGLTTKSEFFYVDSVSLQALPIRLAPQTSTRIRVWFRVPSATGVVSDTLYVVSDASNGAVQRLALRGEGVSVNRALGSIYWQGRVPPNPFTTFQDYSPVSMKPIPDVNYDGVDDIVLATENYWTMCLNGSSSDSMDILWLFNTGTNNNNAGSVDRVGALQIARDLNGDGVADVVIGCGGGNEEVYAISGKDGRLIWQWALFDSVNFALGDINGIDASRDFNLDGTVDILATSSATNSAGTQGRRSVYCLNGRTGQVLWQLPLNSFVDGVIATWLGGVVATNSQSDANNLIYGFDSTGAPRWSYNNNRPVWEMAKYRTAPNNETVILAEGTSTLANVSIKALNAQTGQLLWTGATGSGFYTDVKLIADLTNDGIPEVIAAGGYSAFVLNGATGATLWQTPLGSITLGVAEIRKGNRGIDGVPIPVAFATLDNRVLIYDAQTGQQRFAFNTGTGANGTAAEQISVIDDINPDFTADFVVTSRDGRIWCLSGGAGLSSTPERVSPQPLAFSLEQNYPNPFNPTTVIRYQLPKASDVALELFDVLGRKVATLLNARQSAGTHLYALDATRFGLASGVYFYRLQAGEFSSTKKMLFLK